MQMLCLLNKSSYQIPFEVVNFMRCLQGAYRKLYAKVPGSIPKYYFRRLSDIFVRFGLQIGDYKPARTALILT